MTIRRSLLHVLLAGSVISASAAHTASAEGPADPARMSAAIRVLASPEFEGRAPASGTGEERTVAWIIEQYKAIGLEPAGENGGWTQTVPLLRTQIGTPTRLAVTMNGGESALELNRDIYLATRQAADHIALENVPMVFVGYGVSAPERDWNDFRRTDLKGKIAVFLINDPDFEAQPGEKVAGKFGGRAMTYYGRWTYKYEEAARRGAVGALIIHDTAGAGYPWTTVTAPGGETFDTPQDSSAPAPLAFQGWLQGPASPAVISRLSFLPLTSFATSRIPISSPRNVI